MAPEISFLCKQFFSYWEKPSRHLVPSQTLMNPDISHLLKKTHHFNKEDFLLFFHPLSFVHYMSHYLSPIFFNFLKFIFAVPLFNAWTPFCFPFCSTYTYLITFKVYFASIHFVSYVLSLQQPLSFFLITFELTSSTMQFIKF